MKENGRQAVNLVQINHQRLHIDLCIEYMQEEFNGRCLKPI